MSPLLSARSVHLIHGNAKFDGELVGLHLPAGEALEYLPENIRKEEIKKSDDVISKTIKEYEELLKPYGFLRTHQSHLVNKACIKRFDKSEGGMLILDNNDSVPVSQRKKEHIIEMLKKG